MKPDVLIVGQGLAGSLLAWELERAGISFQIVDRGHAGAASMVAAGIINPITGRRLVKTWRAETLFATATKAYQEMGDVLGRTLWHSVRVRRLFADPGERAAFAAKQRTGELRPFVGEADDDGFWIEPAARVDVQTLLSELRNRWLAQQRLQIADVDTVAQSNVGGWVIDCTGRSAASAAGFDFVPWEFSKGETLEIRSTHLTPDVVLNQRQWVMPVASDCAWVGATHEPGVLDATPSPAAREFLEQRARALLQRDLLVEGHLGGIRVTLPDKLPVIGRHPQRAHLGLINGLGAKGALFAPMLAQAWVAHLRSGARFDPALDVARFPSRAGSVAQGD